MSPESVLIIICFRVCIPIMDEENDKLGSVKYQISISISVSFRKSVHNVETRRDGMAPSRPRPPKCLALTGHRGVVEVVGRKHGVGSFLVSSRRRIEGLMSKMKMQTK